MQSFLKMASIVFLNMVTIQTLSQNISSIAGKVVAKGTKEPLPFAAVYLAKTTIGVATFVDGTFFLDKIPPGKYDLTISMLGYRTYSRSVLLPLPTMEEVVIELESQPTALDPITILSSKIKRSQDSFKEFKKYFLGETKNANSCSILNPKDVFTYKQDSKLIALTSSSKPIEVINEALGYRITYDLKEFELNYKEGKITTSGIPRFEELTSESARQRKKWDRERDRAYYGSFEHFLKSLEHKELAQNFFVIKDKNGNPIDAKDIIKQNILTYPGLLYVTYTQEPSEFQMSKIAYPEQRSSIEFNGEPITIFDNGNFEEFHNLILYGYFGWSSHVGELLPFGYQPTRKINLIK